MTDDRTATVDGFTHGGEGVVRLDGKAVFVPGTLPGEVVRLRVVDDRKRWARAELLEVLEPSPDRVAPPCPLVGSCGGCDLQHVDPAAQPALKERIVREQLERLGKFERPPVRPGRSVGPALGYRSHARFHAAPDGRLGFHRAGSDEVVAVEDCPVLTPAAQALRTAVGDATGAAEVSVRADGHDDLDPAAAATAGQGVGAVVLRPGPGPLQPPDGSYDLLLEQPDGRAMAMRGTGDLHVQVAGLELQLPADGFFQVSTAAAEALVAEVLAAAGDVAGTLVWDLYAGVGLLSLPLAAAGAEVVAVEGQKAAALAAAANAERNGLTLTVHRKDVREALRGWRREKASIELPDVVVLDPPRTGVGESAMRDLAAIGPPRVVLVACDPASLARDAKALAGAGWHLRHVQPLDLFPMTHHVEAVALLSR